MYAIAIIVIMFYITTKEEVSKQLYMREVVKKKKKNYEKFFELSLTWPVSSGGTGSVSTCLTYRPKDSFPATSSIAPILRL